MRCISNILPFACKAVHKSIQSELQGEYNPLYNRILYISSNINKIKMPHSHW